MLRLKKLQVSGFRSFVGEHEITFPDKGILLIKGKNEDTGGSSGSGKSSLLLSIAYLLGYCPYPATELASWQGDTVKVTAWFSTNQGEIKVRRANGLQLWKDGEQVKGGSKAAVEELRRIFGLNEDMLALLTYRGQGKPGLFLSRSNEEKKELLTQLLGLERFEKQIEDTQEQIKRLNSLIPGWERSVATIGFELESLKSNEDPTVLKEQWIVLKQAADKSTTRLEALKQKRESLWSEAKSRTAIVDVKYGQEIELAKSMVAALKPPTITMSLEATQLRHEADKLTEQLNVINRSVGRRSELQSKLERAQHELQHAEGQACPTCKRTWDKAGDLAVQLRATINDLKSELLAIEQFRHTANELELNIKATRARADVLKAEESERMVRAQADHAAEKIKLNEKLVKLQALRAEELQGVAQQQLDQIAALEKPMEQLQTHINQATDRMATLSTQMKLEAATEAQRQKKRQELKEHTESLEKLTAERAREQDFLDMTKGFLAKIFDEILAQIADETNRILAAVANTRHVTIEFQSEVETAGGKIQKKIVPIANIGGNERQIYISEKRAECSGLSGGMMNVVQLAVDLALGKVVSERTGIAPGWLILDEAFDGLGAVEKESAMEILHEHARDRLVIVVDHASEFQSLIDRVITVQYKGGISTIA